jgi:hypothetical protein
LRRLIQNLTGQGAGGKRKKLSGHLVRSAAVEEALPAQTGFMLECKERALRNKWELVTDYENRWGDLTAEGEQRLREFLKGK